MSDRLTGSLVSLSYAKNRVNERQRCFSAIYGSVAIGGQIDGYIVAPADKEVQFDLRISIGNGPAALTVYDFVGTFRDPSVNVFMVAGGKEVSTEIETKVYGLADTVTSDTNLASIELDAGVYDVSFVISTVEQNKVIHLELVNNSGVATILQEFISFHTIPEDPALEVYLPSYINRSAT